MRIILPILAVVAAGNAAAEPASSRGHAEQVIRSALAKLGGEERLRSRPFELELNGTYDLTVALQGRHPERAEPTPIRERIVVDLAGERSGYEFEGNNYVHSRQHLREIWLPGGRVGFVDMPARQGGWPPYAFASDGHLRHARVLPQVMLIDALDNVASLTMSEAGGPVARLAYLTGAGDRIDLWIDRKSGRLTRAESLFDLPLNGRTTARWEWSSYRTTAEMLVPGQVRTLLDGRELKSASLNASHDPDLSLLDPPAGIAMGSPPSVGDLRPFIRFGEREPQIEQLANGVHVIRGLRPGFRAMFVEFADHVVAIDAPAGWVELNRIPPYDDSRGGGMDELGEKMLRAIDAATGGKPVRFVALTHHHFDHIGGVRPLIANGATIVGAPPAIEQVERFVGRDLPGVLVRDRWAHSDKAMAIELIRLPNGNPKAEGFLLAYLPRQKIAYVTGFFYPVDEGEAQPPESLSLAAWFVDWLDRSGLEIETLYNLHAAGRLQQRQWDELRALARDGRAAPSG